MEADPAPVESIGWRDSGKGVNGRGGSQRSGKMASRLTSSLPSTSSSLSSLPPPISFPTLPPTASLAPATSSPALPPLSSPAPTTLTAATARSRMGAYPKFSISTWKPTSPKSMRRRRPEAISSSWCAHGSRSGAGGEHRAARLRQGRKRTRGQPAQWQDGVQACATAALDFLVTVIAAAADFLPYAASNVLTCSGDFLTCAASTVFTCAANFACAAAATARSGMGGHTPNFFISTGKPTSPKSMVSS
ncbi:uncharacterized protein [Miscanthus floridulus]|uniref:uncharacterized protein n=1 Tax=Miscanthus floridulus TaxID=154761 RepID=UPI003458B017